MPYTNQEAPFPIDPVQTAIAIAYKNAAMIADEVLPRVPVAKKLFKYRLHNLADGFTLPDTKVGRTSQPNQVEFGFTDTPDSTNDYGLDNPIPNDDIKNAPEGYSPVDHGTMQLTNIILLDREVRTSDVVFNENSYAANNKITLSGSSQWSDPSSDPGAVTDEAFESMVMRPNIGILGQKTATALRRHPRIVRAYNRTDGSDGKVPLAYLAEYFEVERIIVGQGMVNIARPGQKPTLVRVWGNHASFIYRDSLATAQSGTTFGFTAQFGSRVAGSIADPDIGLNGGTRQRVGESVKEVVSAPDLGFFFKNAVAG